MVLSDKEDTTSKTVVLIDLGLSIKLRLIMSKLFISGIHMQKEFKSRSSLDDQLDKPGKQSFVLKFES